MKNYSQIFSSDGKYHEKINFLHKSVGKLRHAQVMKIPSIMLIKNYNLSRFKSFVLTSVNVLWWWW